MSMIFSGCMTPGVIDQHAGLPERQQNGVGGEACGLSVCHVAVEATVGPVEVARRLGRGGLVQIQDRHPGAVLSEELRGRHPDVPRARRARNHRDLILQQHSTFLHALHRPLASVIDSRSGPFDR